MRPIRITSLAVAALLAAACSSGGGASLSASPSSAAPSSAAPSSAAPSSAAPSAESPSPSAAACAKDTLATKTAGKLTVGTDNPAFPPYYEGREGGNTEPWDPQWGDPTTGKGFESALAYALAKELGFADTEVMWIVVPFNNSFAPGPKDFDFFIGQVGFNEERAQNADLSDGYFFGYQTVVTMATSKFVSATTVTALKDAKLGAQVGTTSLTTIEDVIKTTPEAGVYNTTDDALEAMQNGQIDGVVVDLPTAGFITSVQVEGSKIVGQIGEAAGGTPEHFSLVLEQDSPLTDCVNTAIGALTDAGTIDQLTTEWLPFSGVPELQP